MIRWLLLVGLVFSNYVIWEQGKKVAELEAEVEGAYRRMDEVAVVLGEAAEAIEWLLEEKYPLERYFEGWPDMGIEQKHRYREMGGVE